jgi:hypothetical protein
MPLLKSPLKDILNVGNIGWLWMRSTSRRPSGSIANRLRRSCDCGSNIILGLDKDSEIDKSRLDLLSKPSEIIKVFSFFHRNRTLEQPSESTRWARRLIASWHIVCDGEDFVNLLQVMFIIRNIDECKTCSFLV